MTEGVSSMRCQYAGGMLAWHAEGVTERVSSMRCQHAGDMLALLNEGVTVGVSSLRDVAQPQDFITHVPYTASLIEGGGTL